MQICVTENDILNLIKIDKRYLPLYKKFGLIKRDGFSNIFEGIIRTIISQQLTNKAALSIINKMGDNILDPYKVIELILNKSINLSTTKKDCIIQICNDYIDGKLQNSYLQNLPLDTLKNTLLSYKGLGPWSFNMIAIFCLQRDDIFSIDDFGIKKGYLYLKCINEDGKIELDKLSDLKSLSKKELLSYQSKVQSLGTVASFYLWALNESKGLI